MAQLRDLLVNGPARFLGTIIFNDNVIFNNTSSAYHINLQPAASITGNRTITLPDKNGVIALVGEDSTYLKLSGGTMTGAIIMNAKTGIEMKHTPNGNDPWITVHSSPNYGIRYFEGSVDKITFSASGNNNDTSKADLCINGNGDGTVTIRGKTILHTGNINSHISGTVNYIPKFSGANTLINSRIIDNGTTITLGGTTTISGATSITNTTASSNTTSGALKVSGGVGVNGQMSAVTVMIGNKATASYDSNRQALKFVVT